jgi:hypothetical protein
MNCRKCGAPSSVAGAACTIFNAYKIHDCFIFAHAKNFDSVSFGNMVKI